MRSLFWALPLLTAGVANAAEFGAIRSMQHGPVGDAPEYADVQKVDGEALIGFTRAWGKYTLNGDPETRVSSSDFKTRIAAGGGWAPTKQFALTGYVDVTLAHDYDEEAKRSSPEATLDAGLYKQELAFFGIFKSNPLVLGGGLGVILFNSESREFVYDGDKYKTEVGSAAMPVLRLFGGISTKEFDGTLGVRFFSMGEAVAKSEDPNQHKEEYDVVRRNPAEIHLDSRIKFGAGSVNGSLAYVLTGQASEQVDEFSARYVPDGAKTRRTTGNARRNKDHVVVGVGGRFDPVKTVGILGGLTWTQASYAKEEYASLEHQNLGGVRMDLGTDVQIQMFRGFFQAGYQLDERVSYTQKNTDRSSTYVDETQRPTVNEGDKVKMSQGMWDVMLGGGVSL